MEADPERADDSPVWREDLVFALCASTVVIGLFLDGWNHINLQNGALGSFFTPWHGVLYAGFSVTATWLALRNLHLVRPAIEARGQYHTYFGIPLRYPFAVFGVLIATLGLVGDAIWHTVFGEEKGVARVIAPFHLVLFSGAALLLAAPIRSGWYATNVYPSTARFRQFFPVLLSLTLVVASVAFMFQWLSAFIDWHPSLTLGELPPSLASDPAVVGTVQFAGVARVLVTNVILVAPLLLALRRWRLPTGSITFVFTVVAAGMSTLTEFNQGWLIVAAVVGGVAGDVLLKLWAVGPERTFATRAFAASTSAVLWVAYFVVLRIAYDIRWPFDLWVGTVGVSMICSVLVSVLVLPSTRAPVSWGEMPGSATTPWLRLRRSSSGAMARSEEIGADRTGPMPA